MSIIVIGVEIDGPRGNDVNNIYQYSSKVILNSCDKREKSSQNLNIVTFLRPLIHSGLRLKSRNLKDKNWV